MLGVRIDTLFFSEELADGLSLAPRGAKNDHYTIYIISISDSSMS